MLKYCRSELEEKDNKPSNMRIWTFSPCNTCRSLSGV